MTSVITNLHRQYRARAEEARRKAETSKSDATRAKFLQDAQLWERMAKYEEENRQRPHLRAPGSSSAAS
jgi:hypothetical protein